MVNYNKQDALERLCFGEFNIESGRPGSAHVIVPFQGDVG
jgi:hypothetical protein